MCEIDKLGKEVVVKSDNVFESLVNKGVILDDTLIKESIRGKWIKAIENNKYSTYSPQLKRQLNDIHQIKIN